MGLNPQALLSGVGAGASIAGGLSQAQAARQQADAEARAASYNARLAEMEGRARADYVRRAGHREVTSQFVRASAGGLRVEGAPLESLAQRAYEIEREAMNEEVAARNTAKLDRSRGASIRSAGKLSARNALIGGGLQAAQFGARLGGGF